MVFAQNSIELAQQEANHFWDREYDKLKSGKDHVITAAMHQCNLNDRIWLHWMQREEALERLRNNEKISDEEWKAIEERRLLLLRLVNDLIEQRKGK
jgi:hypothetical protein